MRAATASQSFPVTELPPAERPASLKAVRALIWVYLILLVFEGAVRKWVLPQLSDPLLLIRDPVVLAIYFFALRANVFPRNRYVVALGIIGVLCIIVTIFVLYDYVALKLILLVSLYGFRCNFLHLPLIFIIADAFDLQDVKKIGRWTLLLMIPMAALMVMQFKASPDSFINKTVGMSEAQQLSTAGGKIRPPATFSFISGPVFYLSVAAAFLIYGALSKGTYKGWLLLGASAAVLVAIIVSGSRACVLAVGLVALAILVILVVRPSAVNKIGGTLLVLAVLGFILVFFGSRLPVVKEGLDVLSERFVSSAEMAETSVVGGLLERVLQEFTEPFQYISKIPISGYGLGLGTAGGARFLVGAGGFLLSENEWMRIIAESGPILGLAFIFLRIALALKLFVVSLRSLKAGEVLPILLFATAVLGVLNGQLGQPTTLGFTVVLAGLCLAAAKFGESTDQPETDEEDEPRPLPRRSIFAERIHGTGNSDHTNGAVGR
ncbi:MAG TPA: O-antigen ligase family protein [Chthoniobacterales bacterium]|nr:O-antigen ligase family protein [Chthoniobacterales bacterium]